MYADGTFVSEKDANLDAEIHRVAAETGREDRLDEVYLELVRPGRSRLYGTGSAGVSQFSRGSTNSTCSSQMSQRMYETRISTLEERLQKAEEDRAAQEAAREAEQAAREALEQRMSQFEEILRRSGQLP
ncbi:uncharacterized protein LOC131023729 [Salvia miltiorrhiza]|nr:uncharacterized protein LOC131023729 [Salvia miltiorrhiza]